MENRVDIHTDDLYIRHYTMADLENRYQLTTQAFGIDVSREAIQNWLTWATSNYSALTQLGQPPYGDYAIELKQSGEVIGSIGIVPSLIPWGVLDDKTSDNTTLVSPEFGLFWAILPAHQRNGYATQAGRTIINYLFNAMQVKQIVATTEYDNIPSQKTMEKLGMTLYRNSTDTHPWCEVVGVRKHP